MANFRSFNDLVISLMEYLRLTQPNLDSKPGTVARDLFIDAPAQEIATLYSDIQSVSNLQSLFSATGTDLTRLASNFGLTRAVGSVATGVATLTTNSMDSDILIPLGSVLTSRNGITYRTTESVLMSASSSNVYKANASRVRQDLLLAGITDEYAVNVNVETAVTGTGGNLGRFSLRSHNIPGISNVTNLTAFSGGTNAETDAQFRTRILSIFAGSNTGTALGYETTLSTLSGISDSIVVEPGDPLLERDGTDVEISSDGTRTVTNPGTGGKVDIYILGSTLQSQVDSFIFNDQSGTGTITDDSNDYILGQQGEDTTLNVAQRRVELLASGVLPYQPVSSITAVAGSSSGTNFVEKYTDDAGQVKGNYELLKDTGDYAGSPFGFDKLHWISNEIELAGEEVSKGQFNGTDPLDYTDINRITAITQDVLINNENSTVSSSNRSSVQLNLTPIRTVSKVTNLTTGERYVISNQNPDGVTGEINTTGRITISGSTLPTATDVLQVDYTWIKSFDNLSDFDNLEDFFTERTAQDSVDWSMSNFVKNEVSSVVDDGYGNLTVTVTHNVARITSINTFTAETVTAADGIVAVSNNVTNVIEMRRVSDGAEVYNTDLRNGTITGTGSVILPTDTLAVDGDSITVKYNATDIFSPDGYDTGTFSNNVINLAYGVAVNGTVVLVNYVANVNTLIAETNLTNLPAIKLGNKFLINGTTTGEQPTSNVLSSGVSTKNLRKAPSNIRVTTNAIPSSGTIGVAGTSVKKVKDVLVTVSSSSGLTIDLATVIKSDLGVSSLSSYIKVVKLASVERVNLNAYNQVSSVDTDYDIVNYKINDNTFDLDVAIKDANLTVTQITLPSTSTNSDAVLLTGDIVRVTFYYANTADSETLYFSRSGTQNTRKVYSSINRIALNYGFQNAAGNVIGTVVVSNFNQPISNSAYNVSYDYVAPKENERITVTYNHNSLINDATLALESVRPITADVLVKEAVAKDIDANIRIVILPEYLNQEQTVIENARDAITTFLNANSLGTTVDSSDVVNKLYSVAGIDRVKIVSFGFTGAGNVLSVTAERNEYLRAGTVVVESESR